MAESQRKVELQEADDLRYLINNARRAANTKIDLALPPIEGEDALRSKVEELVHGYINQTFLLASSNLLINGHALPTDSPLLTTSYSAATAETEEKIEEFEPFNDAMRDRVAKLLQTESELLVEVGRLRREAPVKAAGAIKEQLAWVEELGKDAEEHMELDGQEGASGGDKVDLGVDKLERQEEAEAQWRRGVEGLERLKREVPAVVARMERAKRAGDYALAER